MALRITLEHGKRIIINGAVIENTGPATTMKIHNHVNILRGTEVLTEADATTPARRVCHALQSAYLFEANREEYLAHFASFLEDYLDAAPSAGEIGDRVVAHVAAGEYYLAVKAARKLVEHEESRLAALR